MMFRLRVVASLSARTRAPLSRSAPLSFALQRRPPRAVPAASSARHYSNASARPKTCPSCSTPLPTALPVCTKCSYIAPIPESMSYHEMLGASYEPNPFVVDVPRLKNQFRAVQAVVHPDRWVAKPPVRFLQSAWKRKIDISPLLRRVKPSRQPCLLASTKRCTGFLIR